MGPDATLATVEHKGAELADGHVSRIQGGQEQLWRGNQNVHTTKSRLPFVLMPGVRLRDAPNPQAWESLEGFCELADLWWGCGKHTDSGRQPSGTGRGQGTKMSDDFDAAADQRRTVR